MYHHVSVYLCIYVFMCPVAFFGVLASARTIELLNFLTFLPSVLPGTLEKSGRWHLSLSIFSSMTSNRILPDLLTYNSVTRQG